MNKRQLNEETNIGLDELCEKFRKDFIEEYGVSIINDAFCLNEETNKAIQIYKNVFKERLKNRKPVQPICIMSRPVKEDFDNV